MNEPESSIDYEQQRRDLEELKASKADMAGAISRSIDGLLEMEAGGMLRSPENMAREPFGVAEASARAREPLTYDPSVDHEGKFSPDQVDWGELARLLEHDPEKGREVWLAIKATARHELATGVRAATALEGPMHSRRPLQRARYLAIVESLVQDLQPRGALEGLMVQRMASTFELCLKWQELAIERQELEEWQGESKMRQEHAKMSPQQKERNRLNYGYLPPRRAQAEAIQEAVLMSDRYERAFLRLVRAFRDYRRLFGNLIVAGGQVNITDGPQQVNNRSG